LEELATHGVPSTVDDWSEPWSQERTVAFELWFVERVAGTGNLVVDTAVRRAAARAAARVTSGDISAVGGAVGNGASGAFPIGDGLFCQIYQAFFGEVVGEFLTTMVSAKLQVAFPAVHLMPLGTGAVLTDWIARNIVDRLPSPCEATGDSAHAGESVADLGRTMLNHVVDQALGLQPLEDGALAA
jgi:hypothetical protein